MSDTEMTIETVTVGEQAILEIEAAYANDTDPRVLAQTHRDIANAIEFHLKHGTVKP